MEVVYHVVFNRSQRGINTDAAWKDGPIQLQLTLKQIKTFVCENDGLQEYRELVGCKLELNLLQIAT